VIVIVLAIVGATTFRDGLAWGAWLMAALFVVLASVQWLSVQAKAKR
jgi:hypothetical protein